MQISEQNAVTSAGRAALHKHMFMNSSLSQDKPFTLCQNHSKIAIEVVSVIGLGSLITYQSL